jgi:hypothetical protein
LEEAVHDVIGLEVLRQNSTRIIVYVYADLATMFTQRLKPKSGRSVMGESRDMFEAFFVEFNQCFPNWALADMRTEHGVETKLMGDLAKH